MCAKPQTGVRLSAALPRTFFQDFLLCFASGQKVRLLFWRQGCASNAKSPAILPPTSNLLPVTRPLFPPYPTPRTKSVVYIEWLCSCIMRLRPPNDNRPLLQLLPISGNISGSSTRRVFSFPLLSILVGLAIPRLVHSSRALASPTSLHRSSLGGVNIPKRIFAALQPWPGCSLVVMKEQASYCGFVPGIDSPVLAPFWYTHLNLGINQCNNNIRSRCVWVQRIQAYRRRLQFKREGLICRPSSILPNVVNPLAQRN
jgi:hypothetical protein